MYLELDFGDSSYSITSEMTVTDLITMNHSYNPLYEYFLQHLKNYYTSRSQSLFLNDLPTITYPSD